MGSTGTNRVWMLRQFYLRRFLRIFPLYYLVIVIGALVNLPPVREEFWWLASYLYNYRVAYLGWFHHSIAHFWSLAVEEQFYLFWPWVVLYSSRRALVWIAIVMSAVGPASRFVLIANDVWQVAPYVITPSCLDALGFGALLAIATGGGSATEQQVKRLARSALPLGLIVAVTLETLSWKYIGDLHMVAFDTALALIFTWLVAAASSGMSGPVGSFLTLRPVAYVGRIAYGVYVIHLVVALPLFWLGKRLGLQWEFGGRTFFASVSLATLALASLSWHLFEKPLNDLKRHFPYAPNPTRQR